MSRENERNNIDSRDPRWVKLSREELMALMRECAAKLGHPPSMAELNHETGVYRRNIVRRFGTYSKALAACGMERQGAGFKVSAEKLFADWAGVVRQLGNLPTQAEYELHGRYSASPVRKRFGVWRKLAEGMFHYAMENGLESEWADVLEVIKRRGKAGAKASWNGSMSSSPKFRDDRPVYGASLSGLPVGFAPTNEAGVMVLFGAMASGLGFFITYIGTEYPDGEAIREVAPGKCQLVKMEFEFESRNFLKHLHDPSKSDLIICWEHNWPECPVEVLELKSALAKWQSRNPWKPGGTESAEANQTA